MRIVHPAALVGLLLNVMLFFILYRTLESMELAVMDDASRAAWGEFNSLMLGTIRPFHMTLLFAQTAALVLMVMRVPFVPLVLAFIAAGLTLPGSLVYLIGCLLSHYRIKYAAFPVAPPAYQGASFIFPSFAVRKMRVFAAISFAAGLFLLWLGDYSFSVTFFAVSIVGVYCLYRAKAIHALSLHDRHLTLSPGLLAPKLLSPYDAVELATLFENGVIQFEIGTPGGTQRLVWPSQAVEPALRRQAIEELGSALGAHGVPLQ